MKNKVIIGLVCFTLMVALSVSMVYAMSNDAGEPVDTSTEEQTEAAFGDQRGNGPCSDDCEPMRLQKRVRQQEMRELGEGQGEMRRQQKRLGAF